MKHVDLGDIAFPRDDSGVLLKVAETSHPATPYDEFRYPGKFYPHASPERMAALATLFGLKPTPVERCRVLELGCGEGGHLVPLAYTLPESRFLGVDLSQASIARARELADRVGTRNIAFRAQDLRKFPADGGEFDYIIAHGLFSWVPEDAQQALLEICGRHLAPHGLAYISYNTFPGAHLRQIPRDLTLFHTRAISDPAAKVREAHNIVDFMIAAMPEHNLEREVLRNVAARYKASDALTRFDLLAEVNEPVYFLDFMEHVAACGLQFVAESDIKFMRTAHLPERARQWLDAIPDRLLREQYLDFIHCRGFRKTILCRAGNRLDLDVTPERMSRLMVAGSLRPSRPISDFHSGEEIEFRTAHGQAISCKEALPKAVYFELGAAFPKTLPYRELRMRACSRLGHDESLDAATEAKLIRMLVSSLANGVAEFHVYQPAFRSEVGERPLASAMARIQAEGDGPVTSMYLASFILDDPVMRGLLLLLDGSRDRRQLQSELRMRLGGDGAHAITAEAIERALRTLADYGMLIG
jgi:SAM-dependent methyltransferase